MFGISGSEAVFWMLLALIVIGPANLPGAARAVRDVVRAFRQTLDTVRAGADARFAEGLQASGLRDLDPRTFLQDGSGPPAEDSYVPSPPPAEAVAPPDDPSQNSSHNERNQ